MHIIVESIINSKYDIAIDNKNIKANTEEGPRIMVLLINVIIKLACKVYGCNSLEAAQKIIYMLKNYIRISRLSEEMFQMKYILSADKVLDKTHSQEVYSQNPLQSAKNYY